jgi:tRNA(Arg) A34 adenosine deaminase TadA
MANPFMKRAVELSRENMRSGQGGPFGAVVVRNGVVIAEGWNQVTSSNDPTAHAEVTAIRRACEVLNSFDLQGCEIYTSCEPCPMCLAAIYWARIEKIYYANTRSDAARIEFDDEFLYQELKKDIEERAIPMIQIDREQALPVFEEWSQKTDKIPY